MTDAEYLEARYGSPTSDRKLLWIVGATLAVLAIGWLTWQAILLNQPTIVAEEAALSIVSESEVEVTFNLNVDVGSTVTCTVRAYTENTTEVGVKDVTVGPVTAESSSVTVSVATIQPANGARVTDCRFVTE